MRISGHSLTAVAPMLLALVCLAAPAVKRYPVNGIILKIDRPSRTFVASIAARLAVSTPVIFAIAAVSDSMQTRRPRPARKPARRFSGRAMSGVL